MTVCTSGEMLVQPSKARHVAISCKSWKLSFTLAEPINYERNWRPLAVQLWMMLYTKVLVVSCGERILMTSKQPSWSQQRTGVMLPSGYSVASSNLTLKYSMQVSHGGCREVTTSSSQDLVTATEGRLVILVVSGGVWW